MAEMPKPEPMLRNERLLREKVCCSAPWADAALAETRAGKTVTEFYPPGGKAETGMRKCPDCGKWCPPNIVSPSCCDCELEQSWEWLDSPARKHLWPELRRLWWLRAMPFTELVGQMLRAWRTARPALASENRSEERSARLLSDMCECDTIEEGGAAAYGTKADNASAPEDVSDPEDAFDTEAAFDTEEWLASEDGPRKRAATATYLESAKIELFRLRNNTRRHIALGCKLPVLNENDQSLRREIAHYQRNKPPIPPDVKEFSRADIAEYWIALG